jgi:hypothetical protein
MGRNY